MANIEFIIPWYMKDLRFTPGTVADIGNIRLVLKRRNQQNNNNWRLYMHIRTKEAGGVREALKKEVAVAEYDGKLSLSEAQEAVRQYFQEFVEGIVGACLPTV